MGTASKVRFVSVRLEDRGPIRGRQSIEFGSGMTVIAGGGGSGKTSIFRSMAELGPGVKTRGERGLLLEHGRLVFLAGNNVSVADDAIPAGIELGGSVQAAGRIFMALLEHKPWKARMHSNMDPGPMAAGEWQCLRYAMAFAEREALRLDLPLVLDSSFGRLDDELRQGLVAYLQGLGCQVVILASPSEVAGLGEPDYFLKMDEEGTKIRRKECR